MEKPLGTSRRPSRTSSSAGKVINGQVTSRVETVPHAVVSRVAGATRRLVARRIRRCPVCGVGVATTELSLGPVFVRVCSRCSQAPYHVMGVLDWLKGVFGG